MELFLAGLLIIGSYLFGGIPSGFLLIYLTLGKDLRKEGSGNIGATNAYRASGRKSYFLITFIADCFKGWFPVFLARTVFPEYPLLALSAGAAALFGNIFNIYLRFRGGRGVATAAGVFLSLLPRETLYSLVVFLIIFRVTRIVALGSVTAAIVFPVLVYLHREGWELFTFSLFAAILIIFRHRQNLINIFCG